jgi:hypothetical protein
VGVGSFVRMCYDSSRVDYKVNVQSYFAFWVFAKREAVLKEIKF